ncbi:phage Gp37/Gp68 family protein [Mycobacterium sp.]|uniref:DUF5131 family protein n=1 Tax=Mycobacterium sp. TaxID=1785 RepID=UPI0025D255D9|nr:phage Gp37/Gp68 family protein [Mycobacterium sp.]
MSDKTGIEWTDATWNPVTGCDKVSPGCDHCYAETIAHRFDGTKAYPNGFRVTLRPERVNQPIRWRRPRRIFVNSMSDLFHDQVPTPWLAEFFAVMAATPRHTYQILTKRHGRMRILLNEPGFAAMVIDRARGKSDGAHTEWPLPNVWLGVSTENQRWADIRIPALLDTPAAVRFISAEPLLGPIDLQLAVDPERGNGFWSSVSRLHWVIAGGESGPGARPMHPDWARSLRDQCETAGVPFLFKQWGEFTPETVALPLSGEPGIGMRRVGKKAAGRELDGRTWDQYPQEASVG